MTTTVKELKEFLCKLPDDLPVEILEVTTGFDPVTDWIPLDLDDDEHIIVIEGDKTLYIGVEI